LEAEMDIEVIRALKYQLLISLSNQEIEKAMEDDLDPQVIRKLD
jgi:hypothetical protein